MRRRVALGFALAVAAAAGSNIGMASTAAAASYPTSKYTLYSYDSTNTVHQGYAYGTLTWFNRSVGVQGGVVDWCGNGSDYTKVIFEYYSARNKSGYLGVQSRQANDCQELRSYNFTLDGSAYSGGIGSVYISVCTEAQCNSLPTINRP